MTIVDKNWKDLEIERWQKAAISCPLKGEKLSFSGNSIFRICHLFELQQCEKGACPFDYWQNKGKGG